MLEGPGLKNRRFFMLKVRAVTKIPLHLLFPNSYQALEFLRVGKPSLITYSSWLVLCISAKTLTTACFFRFPPSLMRKLVVQR